MVLDPIPQSLPVHFFGSRPQPPTSQHDDDYRVTNMKMCDMTLATRLLHIRDYYMWQDSIHLNICVTPSYWWLPPWTEEIELKTITTSKISNKFPWESPYISNTFSRESPKFQKLFQLSKRSPRRSKGQAGKLINLEIQKIYKSDLLRERGHVWKYMWLFHTGESYMRPDFWKSHVTHMSCHT